MPSLPRNAEVAEQFELLADLLELEGAESFRVLAYRRAAQRMRESSGSIAELALAGRAKEISGIGKVIEEKIVQIVEDGTIKALADRRERIPPDVVQFMRLPGLGPKSAAKLWRELNISTLEELRSAVEAERLRGLPGFGARTEERVRQALATAVKPKERRPLLGQGLPAVLAVVDVLREHPLVDLVSEAGSVRRRRETFRDLDIIATAADPPALTDYFTKLRWVAEVAAKGPTKATVVSNEGLRFDLRVVPPEAYGDLLQHFTGSQQHNVAMREDAVRRGLSVSEYGVQDTKSGALFQTRSEEELYEHLGYEFIPPELRENAGELEAARRRELPKLVDEGDLRGDLHSSWSADGRNTIEEMALKALARGYSYLAITDHSHYLREGRMEAQSREIDAVAALVAPVRLLKGVEVNIRADGMLDVADEVLAERDWVVASLHSAFDRNPTERIIGAMENPNVDCIGHLTARKINKRGPADVDLERVFAKAVETRTFVELNSQPDRLDLRDVHARAAGEAGVRLVISSDGHEVAALGYAELGVAQARRAWLTKGQIWNTRPWSQIERRLKR